MTILFRASTLVLLGSALLPTSGRAQQPVYRAATEAAQDPALAILPGGSMLSIPGLLTDLVIGGGGQFVELQNGTARLTGRCLSQGSLYSAFLVDIVFTGRTAPGSASYPPVGSPDLQLQTSAYVPSGSIDPGQFVYYTAASGTLVGSSNYLGAILDLQLIGPAAQMGLGANNRNGVLGLQASFQLNVVQQPASPFAALTTCDLTINLPTDRTDKVTHPKTDPRLATTPLSRAMTIPWVGDYVFVPAGSFRELPNGTAQLNGRLVRLTQLDDAWNVTLQLSNRIDPGQTGYPPAGSPVRLMQTTAYAGSGGTIDPSHWHYYSTATGTLTGTGYNAGGVIALQQASALQYGGGANQQNSFYGYHGVFQPNVTSHPIGRTLLIGGHIHLFGLTQTFPELPPASLTVPTTQPTLPTLTDQGMLLEGDNLAWAELVGVGPLLHGAGNPSDWHGGWFEVVDNEHIEVHPRPGRVPGTYNVAVYTEASRSNLLPVTLTAPTSPTLYAEDQVRAPDTLHVLVHQGSMTGPAMSAIAMSPLLQPTVFPGLATLGIGNQNQLLTIIPASFLHDPSNGITQYNLGPVPAWYTGFTMNFQAVTIDLVNFTLPLPVTNIWAVSF